MTSWWSLTDRAGRVGVATVVAIALIAVAGPLVAPHSPAEPVGFAAASPSGDAWLGTDFLGRDVFSRVLNGGGSVLLLGASATALGYLLGGAIGLIAGYSRSLIDPLLMRSMDVILAFPALLVLLVLVTGAGSGAAVLVVGVALVQTPAISRIVRTATVETSVRGYVEAAVVRGETVPAVLWREILPNIVGPVFATFGLRFTLSVILIASVNFLGLGLQPPSSDWGVMVSENRAILDANPFAVLGPTLMLALLTIGITLVGDTLTRTGGSPELEGEPAS